MKNKDKYKTFNALQNAFRSFCTTRRQQVYDCRRGFGCAPLVVKCILCYEMWKDSDTELEEREMREKFIREQEMERQRDEFERKYPGIAFYDRETEITDSMEYYRIAFASVRVANILERNGIKTLEQYLALTEDKLKLFDGMGKKSIAEILTTQDSIRRYRADHAK